MFSGEIYYSMGIMDFNMGRRGKSSKTAAKHDCMRVIFFVLCYGGKKTCIGR